MTTEQTVVLAFEQAERIDRLLQGGASVGVPDAGETRKLLSVYWGLAEPGDVVQVPMDVTGRVLAALSRMRHYPGDLPRQEMEKETAFLACLLLAVSEDVGQLATMLASHCTQTAASA
jgi:hypothetical protein